MRLVSDWSFSVSDWSLMSTSKRLTQAAESLRAQFPAMFKPSTSCRAPHLNVDALRNELHKAALLQRRDISSSAELVAWLLQAACGDWPRSAEMARGHLLRRARVAWLLQTYTSLPIWAISGNLGQSRPLSAPLGPSRLLSAASRLTSGPSL